MIWMNQYCFHATCKVINLYGLMFIIMWNAIIHFTVTSFCVYFLVVWLERAGDWYVCLY